MLTVYGCLRSCTPGTRERKTFTTTHCNALHHTATHCNTLQHTLDEREICCSSSLSSSFLLCPPSFVFTYPHFPGNFHSLSHAHMLSLSIHPHYEEISRKGGSCWGSLVQFSPSSSPVSVCLFLGFTVFLSFYLSMPFFVILLGICQQCFLCVC